MKDPARSLRQARQRIDTLDRELARLLQQRARQALVTAEAKKALGLPLLDAAREKEVLGRVTRSPRGPLSGKSLEAIFRRVISEIRATERSKATGGQKKKG